MSEPKRRGRPPATDAKYRQVADLLRERILNGELPHGAVLPSIQLLAREYGVGRQTVRLAVNALKDENHLVLNAHRRLVIKRNVGALTNTKGVILQVVGDNFKNVLKAHYFCEIQRGILFGAGDLHQPIHIAHDGSLRDGLPPDLLDLPISGVVITLCFKDEVLARYEKLSVPVVMADRPGGGRKLHSVSVDNLTSARDATRRLINMGHQRLAFVRYALHGIRDIDPDSKERLEGFRHACKDANLPASRVSVLTVLSETVSTSPSLDALFTGKVRCTAVVCASDATALMVIAAARRHGLNVPKDLSVIGFQAKGGPHPDLAGPRADFLEVGRRAVNLITKGKSPPIHERVPAEWHDGITVAPPRP